MFSYCLNNPVCLSDTSGTIPASIHFDDSRTTFGDPLRGGSGAGGGSGYAYAAASQSRRDREERRSTLTYSPYKNGKGSTIHNSHNVWNVFDMIDYLECNKGSEIMGSTVGVIFEWFAHNLAYEYYCYVGNDEDAAKAGSLDLGGTIWDDDHPGFTEIMIGAYYLFLRPFFYYDTYIEFIQGG